MDPLEQIYFTLNTAGFWFSYTRKNRLHILLSVIQCIIFYFTIFYILLQIISEDVNGIVDPKLIYLPGSLLLIVGQIIFFFKRHHIKAFLDEFNDILKLENPNRNKFKSYYLKSWKYLKLFYGFQFTGYTINYVVPLFWQIIFVILGRNDFKHFPPLAIMNLKLIGINIEGTQRDLVLIASVAIFAMAWEFMFCGIIAFSCIVLSLIAFELKLFKHEIESYHALTLLEDTEATIKLIVSRHRQLLTLVQNLKNIFALPLGIQNLIISVCLCLFAFIVITVNNMGEAIPFSYGVIAFTQIGFLYGYLGDKLRTQGEAIFTALCELPWYQLKPGNRKYFIIILLRASKSLQMEYKGILITNLESFLQILQMAYSCFTLLKSKN